MGKCKPQILKHKITLQLADSLGFPVSGTEFDITLGLVKQGPVVTVQIPQINFQVGQVSDEAQAEGPLPGGYIYTTDNFIPERYRPAMSMPQSIVAASNNGQSMRFSYAQDPSTLPQPPVGYIVQITNDGQLQIQCAGTFGNIIPPNPADNPIPTGAHVVLPCTLTYLYEKQKKFCKNFIIQPGFTNVTQFRINSSLRDFQTGDVYDNVVAYTWADNSTIPDKSHNNMNCMVAIGKIVDDKVIMNAPLALTNLATPPNKTSNFNHVVAINRTNKDNIVVAYLVGDRTLTVCPGNTSTYYRAVSFDGGLTWSHNGPLTLGPPWQKGPCALDVGDLMGVKSDKYGNIWYGGSVRYDGSGVLPTPGILYNRPFFAYSTDGGITFSVYYTVPVPAQTTDYFDYPLYCFGANQDGQYGLWFVVSKRNNDVDDIIPFIGFIPISGLGTFGTTITATRPEALNTLQFPNIAASMDGRVWLYGTQNSYGISSYIQSLALAYKSPSTKGAIGTDQITENWSGVWGTSNVNDIVDQWAVTNLISYPQYGFYCLTNVSFIYDDKRQALYRVTNYQSPYYSQNMKLSFQISRNNGSTWSEPININNDNSGNRGMATMALDDKTGNLLFGFYDGRNDKTYQNLQYYGAILSAENLDCLVEAIPLSNPTYIVPVPPQSESVESRPHPKMSKALEAKKSQPEE